MNPGLVHYQCFDALKSVFEARDLVLEIARTTPSSFVTHTRSNHGNLVLERSLSDLFYEEDGDGRATNGYWALVEVDCALMEAIENLNNAKQKFKAINLEMARVDPNSERQAINSLKNPGEWPTRLQRYAPNYGRLNINHVYRHYAVFEFRPEKVQQAWTTKDKSIVKISKKQALSRLLKIDDGLPNHLRIQYEKLASLKDSEPLAVVRPQTPCVKTNLFQKGRSRPVSTTSKLPIIVPAGESRIYTKLLAEDGFHSARPRRQSRSDIKLEADAIAPSIHVYRYREIYA